MENLKKYINKVNKSLLESNFSFEALFHIIHNQEQRIFCEYIHNYQIQKISYNQMKEYCYKMASCLKSKITDERGSYVGLYIENSVNWIASFWGLLMLGYKPMLLNCKLPIAINLEIMTELNIKSVVTASQTFDEYSNFNIIKLNSGLNLSKEVLEGNVINEFNWEDEIALSTTATTQKYKICIYSGSDITHQVLNTKSIVGENPMIRTPYKGHIKMLCFLPMYHIFGLVASYFWFSVFGRIFVFLIDYSSDTILKTIKRHEVTHIFAVPLLWNTIVREVKKSVASLPEKDQLKFEKGLRLSYKIQNIFPRLGMKIARKLFKKVIDQTLGNSVKFMISGGGYISRETLYVLNGVGYPLFNGYGSTEVGISSVELRRKPKYRITGSVGRPFKSMQYHTSDGELLVKGKSMCSYIIPRNETRYNVDKDQWYKTKDNVYVDKNGYYFILGRADDVVVDITGEKINPDVIEKDILLTTVNNYCILDYQNELSLVVEVSNYTNAFKLQEIYNEVKNTIKTLNEKGYKISKVYYTNDAIINQNAIKVSRKLLKNKLSNNEVILHPIDKMIENKMNSNIEISNSIMLIVREQFALVLGVKPEEVDCKKHFIFELGGSSLEYCTLLLKLKKEFNVDLDFTEHSCSTVEEFSMFISEKVLGGRK